MSTLIDKLTGIKTAKDNLKAAFEGMGLNPGNDFSSYANFAQEQLQPAGSGVKLFSTIAEMDADPNPHEGDKAIVYNKSIQNWQEDTQSSTILFPSTVTLPDVLSEDIWSGFRPESHDIMVDCSIEISNSSMRCNIYTEDSHFMITYTSEDGQHYTRTDSYDETIDLGTAVACEYEWNNIIGYFCQIGGYNFDGVFKYQTYNDTTKIALYDIDGSTVDLDDTKSIVSLSNNKHEYDIESIVSILRANNMLNSNKLFMLNNKLYTIRFDNEHNLYYYYDYSDQNWYIGHSFSRNTFKLYEFDFVNETLIETTSTNIRRLYHNNSSSVYVYDVPMETFGPSIYISTSNYEIQPIQLWRLRSNSSEYVITSDVLKSALNPYRQNYLPAPNQLSLNNANQILPGKIAYGKNGIVVGDDSIYNNLKTELISDSLCGNNNLNDLYYYENIPSNSQEARYNLLKNKIIKFNKSTSQTDKKIGILKEHINLQGKSSYNRFIVDGLSIGLVFTRGDNNYEVVILDNNGQTHYLYDEMPENCGGILRAWYYNNHIYIIFSDKTNASIYKLYKCTNTDDIEMITEIICPDTVAYFIDNSIFYINNGTYGQGSRKLYKFDLINELSSSVDLPFSVSSSHYLSRIGNVLTMCVYKLNDTFKKQTTLLQWNTNLELITNQEYTTNNTSNYMINQRNVMAFRLNNKLYFSQYGCIYEADEINHTYNYVGVGEHKSSGEDFIWVSDNESLYTQELFTLFNYDEKNNITINGIWRLNNFALLTYYDNNFVEIVELIDVDQINNISNNGDIVTIIFNEKNNICTINPIGKIINIIE